MTRFNVKARHSPQFGWLIYIREGNNGHQFTMPAGAVRGVSDDLIDMLEALEEKNPGEVET